MMLAPGDMFISKNPCYVGKEFILIISCKVNSDYLGHEIVECKCILPSLKVQNISFNLRNGKDVLYNSEAFDIIKAD